MQDWVLNRAFKQVPGVIDVTGYGGTVKQYQILVDTRLMKQYGVTMQQVEDAIKKSNANVGGDILALGTQSHNVRAIGLLGKGIDPLDPAKVARSAEIEARETGRYPQGRRRHVGRRHADLRPPDRPGRHRPPAPARDRRPRRRRRRRRGHRPHAQVRKVAADRRSGRRENGGDRARAPSCPEA